jgi:hypothetical protein
MFFKKHLNRVLAFFVFLLSFVTYYRTIAPTVSFWDCGEFIACSYILGIPHPPGAPLYLLIGRFFSMIPWIEDIALRVNLISAIVSALTVSLTYLIIVRLLQIWRGMSKQIEDQLIIYASGIVGALAFAFSDTLWFNAVEAEVYAISLFFTAIVVWLILVWYEKADDPGSDRYLLLIMYSVGLAIGIHLLNILALPAVAMIIYFRRSQITFLRFVLYTVMAAAAFGIGLLFTKVFLSLLYGVYKPLLLPFFQILFPSIESIDAPGFGTAAALLLPIFVLVHFIIYRKYEEYREYSSCGLLVSLGALILVAIYPGIVQGMPWLLDKGEFNVINPLLLITLSSVIIFYLYPRLEFKGSLQRTVIALLFAVIGIVSIGNYFIAGNNVWEQSFFWGALLMFGFIGIGYVFSRWLRQRTARLALLSLFVVLIGCSSYLMIFIRSNLDPVIDENDPETTHAFVSYLNREQYGSWSITDRKRWKPESKVTYSDELDYLWTYQIERMYLRYFAWQFMGKGNTLAADGYIQETYSLRGLFWLPFLLGMLGMYYHFRKDWRQALSLLILFIMTGLAIVIYLNQEDPQPRERDYVYVASYFVFALWIGIGVTAILEWIREKVKGDVNQRGYYYGAALILILGMVPLNMYLFNYDSHDRTGNYVAYDYSYNILQSCAKNGILFTNGDNDTFPLWYLQSCVKDTATGEMGIRKDVRVVNLSLLNTPWYIKQLKNEEPKVPISLTDAEIEALEPIYWKPTIVNIDIPPEVYYQDIPDIEERHQLMPVDTNKQHTIAFEVAPTLGSRERGGIRVQDQMILNIIHANRWKLPIYFAVTVSRPNMLVTRGKPEYNIERYLRMDGLAFRLASFPDRDIETPLIESKLVNEFLYRKLDDPKVFYDDNIMGLLQNYRAGFMRLALEYREKKNYPKLAEILDKMEERVPRKIIPIERPELLLQLGQFYDEAGQKDKYMEYLADAMAIAQTGDAKLRIGMEFIRYELWDEAEKQIEDALKLKLSAQMQQQGQMMLSYAKQMRKRAAERDSLTRKIAPQDSQTGVVDSTKK